MWGSKRRDQSAKEIHRILCEGFGEIYNKYTKDLNDMSLRQLIYDDLIDIDFFAKVNESEKAVAFYLRYGFGIPEEYREKTSALIIDLNYNRLVKGSIDMNPDSGDLLFRYSFSYDGITVTKESIVSLVYYCRDTASKFNWPLFLASRGEFDKIQR